MSGEPLEHKIGQLSGELHGLLPNLERMERLQDELQKGLARAQSDIQHQDGTLERQKTHQDEVFRRLNELEGTAGTANNEMGHLKRAVDQFPTTYATKGEVGTVQGAMSNYAVKAEFKELKRKVEGVSTKVWDIVKLVVAALLGAGGAWLITHMGG